MKVQLLPSSIDENGRASQRQHLLTVIIDDRVAIDAGSLALSCTDLQRKQVRDIVLTHPHLDHIASLPIFIDDLFASLDEPIRIHATGEIIEILERDVFNWAIYPRFSKLTNERCCVAEYCEFERGSTFDVAHLTVRCVAVNHKVSANGYIVSDGKASIAITGDTGSTEEIWIACDETVGLDALFVECAFPDEMAGLAEISHHLTPNGLLNELSKMRRRDLPVYVINIKPMYRGRVISQLTEMAIPNLSILEVGKVYEF